MKEKKWAIVFWLLAVLAVTGHYRFDPWGFYHRVSPEESHMRLSLLEAAEGYLGVNEADGSHEAIVARYNAQEVLPQGYVLQSGDSWCAAFVTVCALDTQLTDIIPPECGCQRQIGLWQELGRWMEDDNYIPAPGDIIYYNWDQKKPGENDRWSDHVGIVVGTKWPFVKVIEGNYDDCVQYRILLLGDIRIRGYGLPDYGCVSQRCLR